VDQLAGTKPDVRRSLRRGYRPGHRRRGRAARGQHDQRDDQADDEEEPPDERPLAAEEVAELSAQQEQAAEGERVRGDYPTACSRWRKFSACCAEGSAMFTIVASSRGCDQASPYR